MHNLEMFGTGRVNVYMSQGIAKTVETRSIGEENDVLRGVKVPDDQITRENAPQGVKIRAGVPAAGGRGGLFR